MENEIWIPSGIGLIYSPAQVEEIEGVLFEHGLNAKVEALLDELDLAMGAIKEPGEWLRERLAV